MNTYRPIYMYYYYHYYYYYYYYYYYCNWVLARGQQPLHKQTKTNSMV
jgi:hypothetical protein